MIQEEKQLLLVDLCARLPYKLHCRVFKLNGDIKENDDILYGVIGDNVMTLKSDKDECLMYYQIKPYLRSMSSMTKEEKIIYQSKQSIVFDFKNNKLYVDNYYSLDYLNSIHVDYRSLIKKGLALEASEDMYKTE